MTDTEPTLTRSVLAGIIGAFVLLVIARVNRSIDLFNGDELDQAKSFITLGAPVIAGVLIRGKVTPNTRVQEHVQFGVAAGYAQGLEDAPVATDVPDVPEAAEATPAPAGVTSRRARPVKKAAAKKQ